LAQTAIDDVLDPWSLALAVGLKVVDGRAIIGQLGEVDRQHLTGDGSSRWSGGVLPVPLEDGSLICILNPDHSRRRNKITLMEEIVHKYRRHIPTKILLADNCLRCRSYNSEQEREAYGVGAAALIPWSTFFHSVNSGQAIDEISEIYDVTTQLVEYRIKITGAYRLYLSRQK
jgi:hypothetical protein